ncbi:hypothetical protein BVC80_8951g10 [Macleaya cordata]|uniref:Proton pump-interactor n=1 Tax=Macleaya cordata TaxID=56857 RepID=A0A200QWT9_MACCD|nr:hypothetical protein BVC80_8951g10 [Macleaya cordata]
MGTEVVGVDFPSVPLKNGSDGNSPKSPCLHEKNAVDQCPEPKPKRIHQFYFIKYPSFEDPQLKSKIDQADEDLQKKTEAWFDSTVAIKTKQVDREAAIRQLEPLTLEDKRYRKILDENRNGIGCLHQVLVKLHNETNTSGEKGDKLCSSEEELNNLICSLHFQTQHGNNTLVGEKQLHRAIKQLEGTREKVIASAIAFKKDTYGWTWKTEFRDPVKPIDVDLDGIRKEKHLINARIQYLKGQVKVLDNELSSLDVKLTDANKRRIAAYEVYMDLKRERDQGHAYYYQNRSLLKNVRKLAAEKNIAAMEELSHRKVEKFMPQWSSSKAFRDVYMNRILPSLDSRKLSRDGRMMNTNEKPLVSEFPSSSKSEAVTKPNIKRPKEMKREEEIAKAKVALERKKKLAEKAAAKEVIPI